jgi:glycosyltransferase involved in cell wall biosynthesis
MTRLAAESKPPALSAIVPALNAGATIARCLDAIIAQASDDVEIIVVDDGSTDNTFEIASRYDVRSLKLPQNTGPSAARNRGAEMARAPILFFLDADVALAPGGLAHARAAMSSTDAGAVIGSYDDDPAAESTISRFKNLAHHYFHQRSGGEATTFWGACGLVRRELFFAAGGFDENRHQIEDVELGYRMTAQDARIVLDRELQVKHLKRWTLRSLVATEVRARAIPWTLLWLEGHRLPTDLNFSTDQRVAAVVALAIPIAISAAIFRFQFWILVAVLVSLAIWVNRDLYRLLFRRGGLLFSVNGFLLQQFYYLYSLAGIAAGVAIHFARLWRLKSIRHDSV